jgi:hypothetical protein
VFATFPSRTMTGSIRASIPWREETREHSRFIGIFQKIPSEAHLICLIIGGVGPEQSIPEFCLEKASKGAHIVIISCNPGFWHGINWIRQAIASTDYRVDLLNITHAVHTADSISTKYYRSQKSEDDIADIERSEMMWKIVGRSNTFNGTWERKFPSGGSLRLHAIAMCWPASPQRSSDQVIIEAWARGIYSVVQASSSHSPRQFVTHFTTAWNETSFHQKQLALLSKFLPRSTWPRVHAVIDTHRSEQLCCRGLIAALSACEQIESARQSATAGPSNKFVSWHKGDGAAEILSIKSRTLDSEVGRFLLDPEPGASQPDVASGAVVDESGSIALGKCVAAAFAQSLASVAEWEEAQLAAALAASLAAVGAIDAPAVADPFHDGAAQAGVVTADQNSVAAAAGVFIAPRPEALRAAEEMAELAEEEEEARAAVALSLASAAEWEEAQLAAALAASLTAASAIDAPAVADPFHEGGAQARAVTADQTTSVAASASAVRSRVPGSSSASGGGDAAPRP